MRVLSFGHLFNSFTSCNFSVFPLYPPPHTVLFFMLLTVFHHSMQYSFSKMCSSSMFYCPFYTFKRNLLHSFVYSFSIIKTKKHNKNRHDQDAASSKFILDSACCLNWILNNAIEIRRIRDNWTCHNQFQLKYKLPRTQIAIKKLL